MTADDIHAFPQDLTVTPKSNAPAPRRSLWPWVLLGVLLVMLLLVVSGASLLMALAEGAREGMSITIDGQRWEHFQGAQDHWALAFAGVVVALVVTLLAVPLAALLALLAAALGIGMVLLALGAVAAVMLSPLWLLLLVLWLALRRRRPAAATMRG